MAFSDFRRTLLSSQAYSDAARRCADIVNLHVMAEGAGRWCAIRLSDGGSDGAIYDSREQAISHQLRPEYCTYVLIPPDGMDPKEAEALLGYWRALADGGVRDDDPYLEMPLMPLTARDMRRQIHILTRGSN
jgi:hypothetical protein